MIARVVMRLAELFFLLDILADKLKGDNSHKIMYFCRNYRHLTNNQVKLETFKNLLGFDY